jgi:DNA-directed RNA polymerase specialized sigma24 family protein
MKKKTKKTIAQNKKVDETEFLNIVDIIAKKLAYKFKFGYHDFDDMKQQISIFALEGLKNYDSKRPLENFLWTHVRNRLFNYKRDNYQRPDKPCLSCPLYDPHCKKSTSACEEYSNKDDCSLYSSWINRNNTKKNLMHLTTIDEVKDYGNAFSSDESSLFNNIATNEILKLCETYLTGEDRIIYLRVKGGAKVSKSDMDKLSIKLKQIISDHG